jgi:hypothetical protein
MNKDLKYLIDKEINSSCRLCLETQNILSYPVLETNSVIRVLKKFKKKLSAWKLSTFVYSTRDWRKAIRIPPTPLDDYFE